MSKESEYWAERWVQLEDSNHRSADETMSLIDDAYRQAEQDVEQQISTWYQRFADNNGIVDMAEARRLLNAGELKEFKWTVDQYIQHGRENGVSANWSKELENASARFHITRLEALKLNIQQSAEVLFGNQLDQMDLMMRQTYLGSYYHTAFLIQTGTGVGWDIAALNQGALQIAVNRPWAFDGRNFSDRIWTNRTALINELQRSLTQSLMMENTCDKTIETLMNKFNVSRNQAARLVYTENAYIQACAQGDSYRANGVQKFVFIATLDDRTSDVCREMDGKVFDIKDYQPGETVPPLHPWCRSATAPHYERLAGIGERAARDPETGKTYYVPREMKYNEWKEAFVDGGSKEGLTPTASTPARVYTSIIAKTLGKSHYDAMRDIVEKCGSSDMRDVWDKFEADIGVADTNEGKRAHCDWNASIHVDLTGSAKGSSWDKPYQTVFHESGHAIDMIAGRNAAGTNRALPSNIYSATYKNGLFPQTIKQEVDALVSARDKKMKADFKAHATDYDWLHQHGFIETWEYDFFKQYGTWIGGAPKYSKSMAYKAVETEIRALSPFAKGDLSDIMEGATREKISVGFGHGNGYWKHGDWTLATEAFAEMVDSTISNAESLQAIRTYLPDSYNVFLDMLKDLK